MENQTISTKNGRSVATQLSSNITLFWRIFLPIFGTIFLGAFTLAVWLLEDEPYTILYMPPTIGRIVLTLLFLLWLYLSWRYFSKVRRIDASESHVYVSNYWNTASYPWEDIVHVHTFKKIGVSVAQFKLAGKGRFGDTISFLPGKHFLEWMETHQKTFEGLRHN
jgi:hypothetical protein